jgi:hypothetical protein
MAIVEISPVLPRATARTMFVSPTGTFYAVGHPSVHLANEIVRFGDVDRVVWTGHTCENWFEAFQILQGAGIIVEYRHG